MSVPEASQGMDVAMPEVERDLAHIPLIEGGEADDEWDEIFRDLLPEGPDDPEPALEPNPEVSQDFRQRRQAQ
jgi:hypothetical protein